MARRKPGPRIGPAENLGNSFGSSQVQFCNGGYIARSGCYPFCPSASGWGCDTGTQGGSNPLGLTQNYTVTSGDVSSGNTSTRAYSPVIDPYQSIRPCQMAPGGCSFDGYSNADGEGEGNKIGAALILGLLIGVGMYGVSRLIK